MPEFKNVPVETSIDVEFEVYCGTCGAGLCYVSDTRESRKRGVFQVTVKACPNCMEEKDKVIKDLENQLNEKI